MVCFTSADCKYLLDFCLLVNDACYYVILVEQCTNINWCMAMIIIIVIIRYVSGESAKCKNRSINLQVQVQHTDTINNRCLI